MMRTDYYIVTKLVHAAMYPGHNDFKGSPTKKIYLISRFPGIYTFQLSFLFQVTNVFTKYVWIISDVLC